MTESKYKSSKAFVEEYNRLQDVIKEATKSLGEVCRIDKQDELNTLVSSFGNVSIKVSHYHTRSRDWELGCREAYVGIILTFQIDSMAEREVRMDFSSVEYCNSLDFKCAGMHIFSLDGESCRFNMKELGREIEAKKRILDESFPESWTTRKRLYFFKKLIEISLDWLYPADDGTSDEDL